MTRYEQGFLTKCASANVPKNIAFALLKRAQQHVSFQEHPETRQQMVVTTQPDGTSTTNSPTGAEFKPGIYFGHKVDVDPVAAASDAATLHDSEMEDASWSVPTLTDAAKGNLVTAVNGQPRLTPEGTNVVDSVYSGYPSPRMSLPKGVPYSRLQLPDRWTTATPSKKQRNWLSRLFGAEKLYDVIPNYNKWADLLKARR